MAPKRQRVAGGTIKRNKSFSDSNSSTKSRVKKFNTSEALDEFTRLISVSVTRERGLEPTGAEGDMMLVITNRGWGVICGTPTAVPLSIVREFYAHAKADKNGFSWVRGLKVDYSATAIKNVLKLPDNVIEGMVDWTCKPRADVDLEEIVARLCVPGTTWKYRSKSGTTEPVTFSASAMNRYARAWNLFICANIMPSSHAQHVTVPRAILLWSILTEKYVDLSVIIHQNIMRFLSTGKGSIPHASVVIRLCQSVGVTWGDDEQLQVPMAPIDHHTIVRMVEWDGGIPHVDGVGYEVAETEGDDDQQEVPIVPQQDQAGPSQAHRLAARAYWDSQFRRVNRRTDALYEANRQFSTDLTAALATAFQAPGSSVNWPVFGSHAAYPPPNSPSEPSEEDDSEDE